MVVVLTDGRDENNAGTGPGSATTFDELLKTLRASEATVFTIALGSNVDRARLEQIASESGGDSYFPETVEALPAEYARIIEDLRRRYVISYTLDELRRAMASGAPSSCAAAIRTPACPCGAGTSRRTSNCRQSIKGSAASRAAFRIPASLTSLSIPDTQRSDVMPLAIGCWASRSTATARW